MIKYPNSWKVKKLNEVGEIVTGNTPSKKRLDYYGKDVPWVKPSDLNKVEDIVSTEEYLSAEGAKQARILPPQSVLVSCIGNLGKVGVAGRALATNQQINAIIFNESIYPRYGYYACRRLQKTLEHFAPATTLPIVTKSRFSELKIPVPPLPLQKKIALVLSKTEFALKNRRETLRLADEFLKSAFLEMFGDLLKNSKKWKYAKMNDVCEKITDGTHHSPKAVDEGIPYITAKNIKVGYFKFSNLTYVSQKDHRDIYKRCDPKFGDVLYIKDGVTTGIAKFNDLDYEFSMLSSLALLRPNHEIVNGRYLEHFLNMPGIVLRNTNQMKGGAIKRLTIEKIKGLGILVPPQDLQQKFADLVQKVEKLKEKQKQSEQHLQNLFSSLMQKAFRGELIS